MNVLPTEDGFYEAVVYGDTGGSVPRFVSVVDQKVFTTNGTELLPTACESFRKLETWEAMQVWPKHFHKKLEECEAKNNSFINMNKVKQVIVIRTDLRNSQNKKVRTGKLIAQACHASIAFISNRIRNNFGLPIPLSKAEMQWIEGSFFKVCVGVDTEQELLDIFEKARTMDLECNLITDQGHTEFNGVPTNTCLALGPDYSSKIDTLTGHLKLL